MDRINFTGIKNIGAYTGTFNPNLNSIVSKKHMLLKLTDDAQGNDLTEFKKVLKRVSSNIGDIKFIPDDNYIHLMSRQIKDIADIPDICINWTAIPACNETMPLFEYTAKLLKKIINTPDDKFVYDKNYQSSFIPELFLIPNKTISGLNKNFGYDIKEKIFSCQYIKKAAQKINDDLQKQMNDFFGIK